ncbi:MAG: hypothetical protein LUE24_04950 [Lachnospiraceae bacterium]|nr:hypothetical protein [Lachnospiraceae bacterium]
MTETGVFDMTEVVGRHIAEIEKKDPALLGRALNADPQKGPEEVAALLTFYPEESRMNALVGFVMAMLCD